MRGKAISKCEGRNEEISPARASFNYPLASFAILAKRASGYEQDLAGVVNAAALLDTGRQPHAAGALYATVEDLYKWDQALYTDKLLPDDLKQKLFTSNLQYYGYGWAIRSISSAPYSSKKVVQKPMMEAKGDALRESCANQK